jgi:hypothetical protein
MYPAMKKFHAHPRALLLAPALLLLFVLFLTLGLVLRKSSPSSSSASSGSVPAIVSAAVAPPSYGQCSSHPAAFSGLTPVLLANWTVLAGPQPGYYLPRLSEPSYDLVNPPTSANSSELHNLDFLLPGHLTGPPTPAALALSLHRSTRVYMLIPALPPTAANAANAAPTVPGWTGIGYAKAAGPDPVLTYGVARKTTIGVYKSVIVVYRDFSTTEVSVPNMAWIVANLDGVKAASAKSFYILLAEQGGGASPVPLSPHGIGEIPAGGRCPDALHEKWRTVFHAPEGDNDIDGRTFSTFHPIWDPCWRCAYDHEHGSNAAAVMGIKPAYDLPAWKNNRQNESHEGFKVSTPTQLSLRLSRGTYHVFAFDLT